MSIKSRLKKTTIFKIYVGIRKVRKIVHSQTFFPQYERKNIVTRYYDNYKWLIKYKRHNPSYNLYGLDVKDFRNCDDYMDIKYVKKDRLKKHHEDELLAQHRKENMTIRYSILADNKHIFYSYMDNICPNYIPKTFFVFQGEKILSPLNFDVEWDTLNAIYELKDGKYICKATMGAFGASVTMIEKNEGRITINKGKISLESWLESTQNEPYLIQEYINQHNEINKIYPDAVNTIRIISTRWNEDTHILAAMLRLGIKGQIVDNASEGGTFVGINTDDGSLMEYGYYYEKQRERKHPDTGFEYNGFVVPYWKETVNLIKRLHPIIFGLSTIGWDIAITETGPVIVEINWNYSIKGIQIACGGLKKRWDELKEK